MYGGVVRGPDGFAPRVVRAPALEPPPVAPRDTRLYDLAYAFVQFRDALSLPFIYLLFHYGGNVGYDGRECPYATFAFQAFVVVQLVFVVVKRLQSFFTGAVRPWWQLEVAYALFMYPWGTAMFILAKPAYYPGAVTADAACDLYHHPMAQTMWIVAEITCSGAGLGLLLLGIAWAWHADQSKRVRRLLLVIAAQVGLTVGWNALTVDVVAPWATSLL